MKKNNTEWFSLEHLRDVPKKFPRHVVRQKSTSAVKNRGGVSNSFSRKGALKNMVILRLGKSTYFNTIRSIK